MGASLSSYQEDCLHSRCRADQVWDRDRGRACFSPHSAPLRPSSILCLGACVSWRSKGGASENTRRHPTVGWSLGNTAAVRGRTSRNTSPARGGSQTLGHLQTRAQLHSAPWCLQQTVLSGVGARPDPPTPRALPGPAPTSSSLFLSFSPQPGSHF